MKHVLWSALCFACLAAGTDLAQAQEAANTKKADKSAGSKVVLPPGITEEMLAPPPVPGFMLKKPSTPLTLDEMMQQARAAEDKARQQRGVVDNPSAVHSPDQAK